MKQELFAITPNPEPVTILPNRVIEWLLARGMAKRIGHKIIAQEIGEVLPCHAMEIPEKPLALDFHLPRFPRNRAERRSAARSAREPKANAPKTQVTRKLPKKGKVNHG